MKTESIEINKLVLGKAYPPQEDEQKILDYLCACVPAGSWFSCSTDLLENNLTLPCSEYYNDGQWEWSYSLIYHIRNYHYRISDEFRAHMEANNWQVPEKYRKKDEEPQKLSQEAQKKVNDMWNF